MPFDCLALVLGHGLAQQPGTPDPAEQIGMGVARDKVCVQDRVDLVLDTRAMPDHLVAAGHQPAQALGARVGCPDLRQVAGGVQARQSAGIDFIGLDMRMGDRLDL